MIKRIIAVSVLGVSSLGMMAANATTNGIYVVGQAGYAATHMKDKITLSPVDGLKPMPNGGIAGRLGVGYQFNPNLAIELGYLQLSKLKTTTPGGSVTPGGPVYLAGTETLTQNAIDVAAKGILPITDKFNAYAKLGVAYLSSTITSKFDGIKGNQNEYFNIAKHKFAPEVGLGVSYNVTNNMFVDTSWTHIQPMGKSRPGNVDFAAVGIGYSFG
jgi:OmpA-OmpF porin, OOP family